jgi:hypothetical protein
MMSAQEERPAARRLGKRSILIRAAAATLAALVGGILVFTLQPERVDPASVTIDQVIEKVALDAPVAPAPAGADVTTPAVDVTAEFAEGFRGDIVSARSTWTEKAASTVITETDQCLLDWSKENLGPLAAEGTYAVLDVCGRATAVLAGKAGVDSKVLVFAVAEKEAPAEMKELLLESTSNRMAFSAVRSADGKAHLVAAAVLPKAPKPKTTTKSGAPIPPPVLNTPPPGGEVSN